MAETQKEFKNPQQTAERNSLLTLILFLNTILMGGVAYFQYNIHKEMTTRANIQDIINAEMKKQSGEEAGEEKGGQTTGEAKANDGIFFPLEGFTANLAQGDGPRRFVRLNAVLKFSKNSNEQEFKVRRPQIRDVFISTLNSKRPEDLLKVEGKAYLKEELKAAINTFLIDGQLLDIYYVGFQVN